MVHLHPKLQLNQSRKGVIIDTKFMIRFSQKFVDRKNISQIFSFQLHTSKMCDLPEGLSPSPPGGTWLTEKGKFLSMALEAKRKLYKCKDNFVQLANIPSWLQQSQSTDPGEPAGANAAEGVAVNDDLNAKVSVWKGDVTALEIDAIVNAANESLKGGGGVDGAIHKAAGKLLKEECVTLKGCETGQAKITGGYLLPAKYVIHTVGPKYILNKKDRSTADHAKECEDQLRNCYQNCLKLVEENNIKSVAFPCISTGIYGYPNDEAAKVALNTTRKWLETSKHSEQVDRIIFCVFLETDVSLYKELMPKYFPLK